MTFFFPLKSLQTSPPVNYLLPVVFVVFVHSQTDHAHGNLAWGSHSIKILCRLVAKHLSLCLATETEKCVNTESEDPHTLVISAISLIALCAIFVSPAFVVRCEERGRGRHRK